MTHYLLIVAARIRAALHFGISIAVVFVTTPLFAQAPSFPTAWDPMLLKRPDVRAALQHLEQKFPQQVDEWIRIAQMLGKSTQEEVRGAYVQSQMIRAGLHVSIDSIGNITGVRKGTGGGPTIVFAAHMDIVHASETNLTVDRDGDTLRAPGIFDNSASVANMLAAIRALNAAKVITKGDLVFVATVQEELGLRGMQYWFDHNLKPDLLVAMDGGLGPINYGALGIYWTRYRFTSDGSHTLQSRGKPTPVLAMADAVLRIYELQPPALPNGAVINVGQVHGGAIFNGIPQDLYFTVDLRSSDPVLLDSLDRQIETIVRAAAYRARVGLKIETEQKNRAGGTERMLALARRHPLVQTAIDIQQHLGVRIGMPGAQQALATGSTDANIGVVAGVPSIAIGRSYGGDQHTLNEWAHWPSALEATKLMLLLATTFGDGIQVVRAYVP
ncbi:MAG: M20/M25/M40 family metallo-hydrolase [Betaproteobacteria bacterium]|nr:M20/M25/M40 family metallo-hydrolase [Betaproteobacteria bacterium]